MNFTALVHKDKDGGFWAEVRELPGCITQGDTEEELEATLAEAIELILDGLVEDYAESVQPVSSPEESEDALADSTTTIAREIASQALEDAV
jgi:antitoxin HicB